MTPDDKEITDNREAMNVNLSRWNELAELHSSPESSYDLEALRAGKSILNELDRELIGDDIRGKRVLHLQCHFGMDTISLLREGASEVVGIDFSEKAVSIATQLAKELGYEKQARFVQANIMEVTEVFEEFGSFDFIFTSYGTIVWLPDLEKWGKAISAYLKPGGKFLFIDSHPFSHIFDDEREDQQLVPKYRYFDRNTPEYYLVSGSYAIDAELKNNDEYLWTHSVGSIISSLIDNGLYLVDFQEYPYISWKQFPFLEQKEDGWYYFPEDWEQSIIPLCLAIKAKKPETQV